MIPKYKSDFEELNLLQCPPPGCINVEIDAYRFSHFPLDHEENFMPQAVKIKKGIIPPRQNTKPASVCSDFGISMFNTYSNAIVFWKNLKAITRSKLGYTHLTTGAITSTDGVITEIESSGHFNLHEYANSNCLQNFVLAGTLPL